MHRGPNCIDLTDSFFYRDAISLTFGPVRQNQVRTKNKKNKTKRTKKTQASKVQAFFKVNEASLNSKWEEPAYKQTFSPKYQVLTKLFLDSLLPIFRVICRQYECHV